MSRTVRLVRPALAAAAALLMAGALAPDSAQAQTKTLDL
jgi:hypothetical protein